MLSIKMIFLLMTMHSNCGERMRLHEGKNKNLDFNISKQAHLVDEYT